MSDVLHDLSGSDFELSLLEAGRSDRSAPSGVEKWGAFAAQMAAVSGSIAPVSGVHTLDGGAGAPSGTSSQAGSAGGTGAAGQTGAGNTASLAGMGETIALEPLLAKWIVLGALGLGGVGIGVVWAGAFFTNGSESSVSDAPDALGVRQVPLAQLDERHEQPAPLARPDERHEQPAPLARPDERREQPSDLVQPNEASARPSIAPRPNKADAPTTPASTLGAEAERLDEARRANSSRAVYLVGEFHRNYPSSPLAADAEIVAMKALLDLGERERVRQRAAQFLARFPGDPHEERVRGWLER